jgi:hypothetical protein
MVCRLSECQHETANAHAMTNIVEGRGAVPCVRRLKLCCVRFLTHVRFVIWNLRSGISLQLPELHEL